MNAPLTQSAFTAARPARFATAEFLEMIEHDVFGDRRVELVEGEIIELPPPGTQHGFLQAKIAFLLHGAADEVRQHVVVGDTGIEFYDGTLRGCDAALVRPPISRAMLRPEQIIVAVEIAISTLSRDLGEKALDYARAEIAVLWVVDPEARVVHVLSEPDAGGYRKREIVRFGEDLAVPESDRTIKVDFT